MIHSYRPSTYSHTILLSSAFDFCFSADTIAISMKIIISILTNANS